MNLANFEAWHFSVMFLLLIGVFSLFFYAVLSGVERFAPEEKRAVYPLLAQIGHLAKRCIPKAIRMKFAQSSKRVVCFLDRTFFAADLWDEDYAEIGAVTFSTASATVIALPSAHTAPSVSALVTQAGRLIGSLDQDAALLSQKCGERINALADAILFLNDEYAERQPDAATDALFVNRLQHMVDELDGIYASLSYTHRQVAN